MNEPNRYQVLRKRLKAVPRYGLPAGGWSVTYSEAKGDVEAAYLWIGEKRQRSDKTIARIGADVLVDVDAQGHFIGLELLRKITNAEAQRFYRWAHRHWRAHPDKPHWPCSAMLSLLNAWLRAEVLACPHCRAKGQERRRRLDRSKQSMAEEDSREVQWTPELVSR